MKNIVFLNSCPVWGGGEKWTYTTAKIFNEKKDYNIYIATAKNTELFKRAEQANIKTQEVKIKSGISFLNPLKSYSFIKFLKSKNIDIMFLNMSQDLKFGGICAKIAGLDRIVYRRGSAIPIKNRFYNKYLLNECVTDIIANSKATKETILRHTSQWLNEDKIKIIYNGIDINKIDQAAKKPLNLYDEFNIEKDKTIIGNIGRLNYQKGHEFLIKAVQIVAKKKNDFVVLIVGSGDREKELKELVKKKNLNDYIIFTGFRDDVYNILPGLDFLVHTARWEGFGFVIAEAMAAKLPVVSTDVSNIAEIVIDQESGYLAESENPNDIANKILKMIDEENIEDMAEKGREIIENNFTMEIMIKNLELFL
ncbi:glycosyltransferase [Halanaerobium sp. Z-7514]|uniref:Glycosyltransferase n=1 Tax=Halanaerobium polyolivorans TaxID=2886943 RepID=A0AAW4WZC1_9FIRM|nr:glycosyltransferase [Halanaerobium polyolivorans]MCC3144279.1 glycosyltransferase [Halanaerobium polyolivorans]